jgi:pimeloyl-ACP methyl ester carboxylesterase
MAAYRRAVKHLEVLEIEGGHHVHLDRPEVVAQALNAFYERTR